MIDHLNTNGLRFSHPNEQDANLYASIFFIMRYAYQEYGKSEDNVSSGTTDSKEVEPTDSQSHQESVVRKVAPKRIDRSTLTGMERARMEKRNRKTALTSGKRWQPEFVFQNVKWIDDYVRLEGDAKIVTATPWQGPFDVTVVARTNSTNIRIYRGFPDAPNSPGGIIWNWECNPNVLSVRRFDGSSGTIPGTPLVADVWYKLRWIVTAEDMTIMVNDRAVLFEKRNNRFSQAEVIGIQNSHGSIVDVKSARLVRPK